jgi:hypothetical protein
MNRLSSFTPRLFQGISVGFSFSPHRTASAKDIHPRHVTYLVVRATIKYERRIKMKNIGKIMIAALLAVCLVALASPSGAWSGHGRSMHKKQYKHVKRYHNVYRYHHYYPKHRYYHYGYHYRPHHFRRGYCSHLGLYHSSYGTRVHIGFGF